LYWVPTAVRQVVGTNTETLVQMTYSGKPRPSTIVDASLQTNWFAWRTNGQISAVTNALGEVVTFLYNSNHYLTNVAGPLGATASFTYDDYGRMRTVIDSEGYSVTYDYDIFDRPLRSGRCSIRSCSGTAVGIGPQSPTMPCAALPTCATRRID
jgi:YD repeat-containing protein